MNIGHSNPQLEEVCDECGAKSGAKCKPSCEYAGDFDNDHIELACVEKIKVGEFVKRIIKGKPSETVYVRGEYDRGSKRYSLSKFYDMNTEVFVKKGTKLNVGFTF